MSFKLEEEKSSEMFITKSFMPKKRKAENPQTDDDLLKKLLKKPNIKKHGRKIWQEI